MYVGVVERCRHEARHDGQLPPGVGGRHLLTGPRHPVGGVQPGVDGGRRGAQHVPVRSEVQVERSS